MHIPYAREKALSPEHLIGHLILIMIFYRTPNNQTVKTLLQSQLQGNHSLHVHQ